MAGCNAVYRYQFFLQAKRDIAEGHLPVDSQLAAELAAYAVQCKIVTCRAVNRDDPRLQLYDCDIC